MSAAMPSAAATRATSTTDARMAAYCSRAASAPTSSASVAALTGNSAEHQPPLRPEAPNPATSCSSTATRSDGSTACR